MSWWMVHLAFCVVLCGSGCHLTDQPMGEYETIQANPHRDTATAMRKNERALKHLESGDHGKAEELLQEALVADVTFAPAHNNLGHLLYLQRKYYLAAWEFEYAAKLMPTSGEPLNNLGLIYERVGRYDEATARYEAAMALNPDNQEFASNLARLQVRREQVTPEIAQALHEVVYKDDRPEWKDWAGEQLHTKYLALKELSVPGPRGEAPLSEAWPPALMPSLIESVPPDVSPVPAAEAIPVLPTP